MQSNEEKSRYILIADSDDDFLESARADPKATLIPPDLFGIGKQAQLALADQKKRFLAVVVNPKIDNPIGISVIRFCKAHRPSTPIIIVHEADPPFDPAEIKQLGIYKVLKKPVTYTQIVDLVAPNIVAYDAGESKTQEQNIQLDAEFSAEDDRFIPIRAADFLSGTKSFFDIFIRLSAARYVKILQANESFESTRLSNYLAKGVKFLYLEKSAHIKYLVYCDKLSEVLIKKSNGSIEAKAKSVLNLGEETTRFLQREGLNAVSIQFAGTFCKHVEQFVKQLDLSSNSKVAAFLDDFKNYEHGVGTAMIAGLIANALQFKGEKAVHLIGLASLFHDIGLTQLPPECQEERELEMTPEQIKLYQTHPNLGSKILSEIKGVDAIVVQAVAQHHERRTRKGFPASLGAGAINRVAEIVGISDDFLRLMKRPRKDERTTIFQEMETDVFHGYTVEVTTAFRSVFFPPEKE